MPVTKNLITAVVKSINRLCSRPTAINDWWGSWAPQSSSHNFFYQEWGGILYTIQYTIYAHQRWSPRGHGFEVLSLDLGLPVFGLGSCTWHWSWAFKYSGNQHSTRFYSNKCQEVLRFYSWAVLFSWLCGFMESDPAGSQFPSTLSPVGKDLLQPSHLCTSREGVWAQWTVHVPTSCQNGR